jgi:hypothetical protein
VRTSRVVIGITFAAVLAQGIGVGTRAWAKEPRQSGQQRSQRLDVRLSATVAFAPAVLRSTVFVEQDPANRMLRVSVDGENYYSSSDIALEGADSPRSHQILWRDLPAGEYQVSTELYGSTGTRAVLVRRFTVVGQ